MISYIFGNKIPIMLVLIVVLFSGSILYSRVLITKIENLKLQKSTIESELKRSTATVEILTKNIDEQNKAVERIKVESAARELAGKKIIEKARQDAQYFRNKAGDLMKEKVPAGISQCDASNKLINTEITRAK